MPNATNRLGLENALAGAFGTDGSKVDDLISAMQDVVNALGGGGGDSSGSSNLDASGKLRISEITKLADYKFVNAKNTTLFDEEVIGGGTVTHSPPAYVLTVPAVNNDRAIIQSFVYHSYLSGNSQFVEWTFEDFAPQDNVTKRMGYFRASTTTPFDENPDGYYLESSGGIVSLVIMKQGSPTLNLAQSGWDDPLDGTGASGKTMDWDKFNITNQSFLWLGGRNLQLNFEIDGISVIAHTYKHSGNIDGVMFESPNQPLRVEITSDGGAGSFKFICATVGTEGSVNAVGIVDTIIQETAQSLTTGEKLALIAVRLDSAAIDHTIVDWIPSVMSPTNANFVWGLSINPTLDVSFDTLTPWTTRGCIEYWVFAGGTDRAVTDNGLMIAGTAVSNNNDASGPVDVGNSRNIGMAIDGTRDVIVLWVRAYGNDTFIPALSYRERV